MVTEDPAVAYDTVSFEPIINTYETLVSYNGTTTASYVPVLSTCVPGTTGCVVDYGSSLIVNGSGPFAGQPIYWTFPIDPAARFYDPGTGANWPVYPSDVMFSLARTMSYANLPFVASQNGWIAAQTLLPFWTCAYNSDPTSPGTCDYNGSAGQAIHYPFNNTPYNILSSMLVNNSTYCPASALAANGCITFEANGGGQDWPFFLQIVADGLGASVVPCGVFTHNGNGLPGFNVTASASATGDGSCTLPGNSTTTSSSAFKSFLNNPATGSNDSYWDAVDLGALGAPNVCTGNGCTSWARTNLIGSGPYSAAVNLATGYTLRANPYYAQPSGCSGAMAYTYVGYCDPVSNVVHAGSYIHQVNVTYDATDSNSISGFQAGTIDAGGIFPSHTVTNLLPLVKQNKVQYTVAHSLSNFFFGYNTIWDPSMYATDFPSEPTPNIATDFFNNVAARQFFTESYPFLNVQNQILSVGGIPFGFDTACGPIPLGMGDYYPTNLTCPGGNPDTNPSDVGGAAWWWAQATTPSSPYYDPEMAACMTTQCSIPIVGEVAAQQLDASIQLWLNEIYTISGHAIKPFEFDLPFSTLIVEILFSASGQNPVPIWNLGWAPDYPDPTDYMAPYAIPEGSYTVPDAIALGFGATISSANNTSCGHYSGSLADMYYWAYSPSTAQIPTACEGIAYYAAQTGINLAAPMQDSPTRVLYYNAAEQILTKLSLYVWFEQANVVPEVAPWININSVNINPTIGGGGDQPFFHWAYNPPNVLMFKELKLPVGVTWSVTLSGANPTNNTTSQAGSASSGIVVLHVPNGTQNYNITAPSGFGVAKIMGPNNPNQTSGYISGGKTLTWTVLFGPIEEVNFYENTSLKGGKFAMYTGAPWAVYLNASLPHGGPVGTQFGSTTGTSITFFLPKGSTWKFNITKPTIYKAAPPHGGLGVPLKTLNKLVKFILLTVVVKFHEVGLTTPIHFTVTFTNVTGAANPWFLTGCGGVMSALQDNCSFNGTTANLVLHLPAGTYNFTVTTTQANTTVSPTSGTITVPPPPHTAIVQNETFTP